MADPIATQICAHTIDSPFFLLQRSLARRRCGAGECGSEIFTFILLQAPTHIAQYNSIKMSLFRLSCVHRRHLCNCRQMNVHAASTCRPPSARIQTQPLHRCCANKPCVWNAHYRKPIHRNTGRANSRVWAAQIYGNKCHFETWESAVISRRCHSHCVAFIECRQSKYAFILVD